MDNETEMLQLRKRVHQLEVLLCFVTASTCTIVNMTQQQS